MQNLQLDSFMKKYGGVVLKSSLIYLFSKNLLFIYYVPNTVLVIKDTKRISSYLQICFCISP